jgi:hypothetical protein
MRASSVKQAFITVVVCLVAAGSASANVLSNPGFATGGAPSTLTGSGAPGGSACPPWTTWNNSPATTKTEHLAHFMGASGVIHVTTTGASNGLVQVWGAFNTGPSVVVHRARILVRRGKACMGTGNGGNTACSAATTATGQWQVITGRNTVCPANETIIYSDGGPADFYVDMASVEIESKRPCPQKGKVIGAKLEAFPREYRGPCPAVITFKGAIETDGPATVKYIYTRSDNATDTNDRHFTLGAAGTENVQTTWTLGGPGLPTYSGWEQISIELPNAGFTSNKAPFHITCEGQPGGPGQPGRPAPGKPDLVIETFGFKGPAAPEPGNCHPNGAVYIFEVNVKNIGTATSPSSASLGNKALVQVMAQDYAGWGNGAFLNALAPGTSQTVDVPVYYLQADPKFMWSPPNVHHPFLATADPLHLVAESNEGNNTKGPIVMGIPQGCPPRMIMKR